jgi:histidinol-phosphate aminotransferase
MVRGIVHIINPYDPGKFPEDLEREYGIKCSEVVSLSSNENPFLPPESVREEYIKAFEQVNRYPHPFYRDLKEEISEWLDIEEERIAVGNGASELLKMVCEVNLEALDPVTIPIPGYMLYAILAMMSSASINFIEFPGYEISPEKILEKDAKIIFLCSPNNPTGNAIPKAKLKKILRNTSALVVVDEAYSDFSDTTFIRLTDEFENLVVVKSFSKFFSLAGLRIGFAVGGETISAIEKVRLPFNLSNVSVRTAIACLRSIDHFMRVREYICKERDRVFEELNKIPNVRVYPSSANFILLRIDKEGISTDLFERRGILVRDVTGLMGLEGYHIRVTIGRREENDLFIESLKELLCC